MTTRLNPPLADRLPAEQVINPHLIAALARAPVEAADPYIHTWFSTVGDLCRTGLVLVFERFVVGAPCPLLLEVAHQARVAHRSNAIRSIDPDAWDDDDDEEPRPPIAGQVIAAMAHGQEADRIVSGDMVGARVRRGLDHGRVTILDQLGVMFALEGVIVSVADTIRIGDAAVIDVRLAFERRQRWAA
jgi:hypothetical protein